MTVYYKVSDNDFITAVNNNISIRAVLLELGMALAGGSYASFKSRCKRLNLDTSHMMGMGYLKGKQHNYSAITARSFDDILVENSTYNNTNSLKKRLIKSLMLEDKCFQCGIKQWCNQNLSLHLDHINGKRTDNRIENLRLLCPNCHSLTDTYCGKNKGVGKKIKTKLIAGNTFDVTGQPIIYNEHLKPKPNCITCGKKLSRVNGKLCRVCYDIERKRASEYKQPYKITWLPIEELLSLAAEMGYSALGRKLGVSDNAIRKHIKRTLSNILSEPSK